ncbi:MAG: putative manganese transporter, partial [Pygmaiobacter sp.]
GLGLVPQCGFSAMAADLYSGHIISLGTLLAVFLSTSDEAVLIFIANPEQLPLLGKLLLIKFIVAIVVGFAVDVLLRRRLVRGGVVQEREEIECLCTHEEGEQSVFRAAVLHTLNLMCWILLFSLIINAGMEFFGSDLLGRLITGSRLGQPALAALVGLIPNCAASVLLAQLYMAGSITFASLIAGLCSAAGIGLVVLFRTGKNVKKNLTVVLMLYLSALAAGLVVGALGF